ncbi:glycosyltransferase family 2 protein [Paenochrobactrum glaciei]|uniref:Glycosyltransferase n=1 Tax=Paenochrobactrum glaciei TaxID=486407 RepID=A0ABN1FUM3_9HYPH
MQNIDHRDVKLSILVPCYNVSKYINECLDSIADQMTDECEVIIYDDGSKDDTVQKISEHRIVLDSGARFILAQENRGLSYARNSLLKHSNGQYVWFLDSDDKILDSAINNLINCIQLSKPDIIFFDYNTWYQDPTPRMIRKGFQRTSFDGKPGFHHNIDNSLYNLTVKSTRLHAWSKVYNRNLFKVGTEFPVGKIFEDVAVVPLLSAYAETAYYLNQPFLAYRIREGSILSSLSAEKEIESLKAINELKSKYEKNIGALSKKSHMVTTYFATWQLRQIIKAIAKHPDKQKCAFLIEQCLNEFKKIHGKTTLYALYACLREGDFFHFLHCSKRLIQAYLICYFNKQRKI